ncbi:MAG: polysaccharide biosynthesis protein [Rhodobacteraceae bacterium]|nr:polysaccharide biosynthesis protein [Paracoccaceae bacterium]
MSGALRLRLKNALAKALRPLSRLSQVQKIGMMLVVDSLLIPLSLYLSVAGLENSLAISQAFLGDWEIVPLLVVIGALSAYTLGLPRIQLNDYETAGMPRAAVLSGILAVSAFGLNALADGPVPASAFIGFGALMFLGMLLARVTMRAILIAVLTSQTRRVLILIYGAGRTGMQLAAALRHDDRVQPVAFVDDNPALRRMTVSGLPVLSPAHLEKTVTDKGIERVILAMPSLSTPRKLRMFRRLAPLGVEVQALPSFAQLVGAEALVEKLAPVNPADFLDRVQFDGAIESAAHVYCGKSVLVTGAGGSIGSELCRQVLSCKPKRLVLMDHSELALYNIIAELDAAQPETEIRPVLGSVDDARLCANVLARNEVQIVLHAAAYKHVPIVEENPLVGLRNNVFGTKVLADAARAARVERFLLVSTDKAVRPRNVMGASKRLAEMVVQDLAARDSGTLFSMVRFGNVLGSSGSVIPLFEQQIANGGPVTLTDVAVTRFFMTIPEAGRLVLLSGALARGGDVFVLDMGEPVSIHKLAVQMIEAAGFTVRDAANPSGDIEIKITGLRPGEKLHEELLIGGEHLTTHHPKILRALESGLSEIEIATALRELRLAIEANDCDAAHAVLSRWVEGAMDPVSVNMG